MAKYVDEAQATADGFQFVHEPEASRYALYRETGDARELVGEAHYTLQGNTTVDFDHTVVNPALRGTGLAGLLARGALTGDVVEGRRIVASCWFIAGYLEKHPELRSR